MFFDCTLNTDVEGQPQWVVEAQWIQPDNIKIQVQNFVPGGKEGPWIGLPFPAIDVQLDFNSDILDQVQTAYTRYICKALGLDMLLKEDSYHFNMYISCTTTSYDSKGEHPITWGTQTIFYELCRAANIPLEQCGRLKDFQWLHKEELTAVCPADGAEPYAGLCGSLMFECWQRDEHWNLVHPDGKQASQLYMCLIHVDINDPDPDFKRYYFANWPCLTYVGGQEVPPEFEVDWASIAESPVHYDQPMWFMTGPDWKQLPPWTQPVSLDTLCLLDYSNLSAGKIVAMNYSYFQIGSQDVNGVGDRSIVKFHLSTSPGG
jgi:hypothetical protein